MDLSMLIIVLVIVIPGYLIVTRLSKNLFSDNQKLEDETENRYGFKELEKKIQEERNKDEKK
ncbi:MAG: hypothetical protein PWP30_1084 [Eubacteriaceae bacterium]|nr:hypothetical protein [Eubacteriaceae bacterium]MDK2962217.1 hypothetical protein [Eubacteriaceae bacterium]